MTLKRLIVSLCIVFICSITFIGGYTKSANIVYADSTTDQWTQVSSTSELVKAFQYYCESRDLTIDGSRADAVTTWTTRRFNQWCQDLGIDITALQAHIKKAVDGNIITKFLFDSFSIQAYNRIFAQFLQDYNLSVGDSANETDNTVYSGRYFTDDNGNSCLVFIIQNLGTFNKPILAYGTNYKYDVYELVRLSATNTSPYNLTFNINNNVYQLPLRGNVASYGANGRLYIYPDRYSDNSYYQVYNKDSYNDYVNKNGYPCIIYDSTNDKLFLGAYSYDVGGGSFKWAQPWIEIPDDTQTANVYLTTNNTVINNNVYEGDTIINNPDGGGGGGSDPDPDDPNYNPYPDGGGGTTPPTNTGGGSGEDDGTITFPDFDFHLPEINWSLGDLSEKFPFSIPFDLIAFFTVLNAEPQAPSIDADIPLGSWYTWHFEADFAQFDNYAVIIRNVEFIGFCVGLIYLTIKLVKG